MSTIKRLLRRWGYAKLEEFGLLLTPDDRIVATRPMVLDDGLGARIVGWRDGDLAALELQPWGRPREMPSRPKTATKPGPAPFARRPHHPVPPARPTFPETVLAQTPPPTAEPALPPTIAERVPEAAPPAIAERVPEAAPPVASDTGVFATPIDSASERPDEDEWEWEIAMARARAAAETVVEARAVPPTVAPAGSSRWIATSPLAEFDGDDTTIDAATGTAVTAVAKLARSSAPLFATAATLPALSDIVPRTVIPVPRLPAAADPAAVIRTMSPVLQRSATSGTSGSSGSSGARPIPSIRHATARR